MSFTESYETLLYHFCGREPEEYRAWMHNPHSIGKYIYSTDGAAWLRISNDKINKRYKSEKTEDFFTAAIKKALNHHINKKIQLKKIQEILLNFTKENETAVCSNCNGEGFLECFHCESNYKCPECKGKGVNIDYTFPMIYEGRWPDSKFVKILSNYITPFNLGRLERVMIFEEANFVTLKTDQPEGGMIFHLSSGTEIVLMPCHIAKETEDMQVIELHTEEYEKI